MQAFVIGKNEAGQRLDKYLGKLLQNAPKSFLYKMLRKKNIVLNGRKADGSEHTTEGDEVRLYLSDETIRMFSETASDSPEADGQQRAARWIRRTPLEILYEDENMLFLNKPRGILSQKAKPEDLSLTELLTAYLLETGKITENTLKTFHPAICNRLDRNTSGIVAAGLSLEGSQQLTRMFRERSMEKQYLCLAVGKISRPLHLSGYLLKDEARNQVKVQQEKTAGALPVETAFVPLGGNEAFTLLLAELITGRSHQIRAHLASVGHPLAGDPKYGDAAVNRRMKERYGISFQMLHAWRIRFPECTGVLAPLSEKTLYAELPADFQSVLKGEGITWQPGPEEDFGEAPWRI